MSTHRPKVQIAFPQQAQTLAHPEERAARQKEVSLVLRSKGAAIALGLFVLAMLSAIPAVNGKFLTQDDVNLTENPAMRSWSGLKPIWTVPWRMPQVYPVSFSALLVQYRSFRESPFGYHMISMLLHALCTLLLWTLLKKIDLPGAAAIAALFAVHPIGVATVAWISQQKVLWATMFLLSSLIIYFRYIGLNPVPEEEPQMRMSVRPRLPQTRWLLYVLSMVLLVLALLSQAIAVTFVPIVLVALWWDRGRIARRDLTPLIAPFLLSVVAAVSIVLVEVRHNNASGPGFPTWLQRVQVIGYNVWSDLLRILLPVRTSFAYPRWQLDPAKPWEYLPTLALLAAGAALFVLRKKVGRGVIAAALLFLILIAPVSGIVNFAWMQQSFVGDHLQYLATAVPTIAVVTAIASFIRRRRFRINIRPIAAAGCAALVMVLLGAGMVRATRYADQKVLWEHTLERNPRSVVALNNLGLIELEKLNDLTSARQRFHKALSINPHDRDAHMNLAAVFERMKQPDRAAGEYYQVLARNPTDEGARFSLAGVLAQQGDSRGAMAEYRRVLDANPRNVMAIHNLADLYAARGERMEAIALYHRALEINPRYLLSRINLANALFQGGQLEEALKELEIVRGIDPRNFFAMMNAGVIYGKAAELVRNDKEKQMLYDRAVQCFTVAISIKNDFPEAYLNKGKVLVLESRLMPRDRALMMLSDAIASFRRAGSLSPGADTARFEQLAVREREDRKLGPDEPPPGR